MRLELKEASWKNLIYCIRQSELKIEGNFWANIQSLEEQIKNYRLKEEERCE